MEMLPHGKRREKNQCNKNYFEIENHFQNHFLQNFNKIPKIEGSEIPINTELFHEIQAAQGIAELKTFLSKGDEFALSFTAFRGTKGEKCYAKSNDSFAYKYTTCLPLNIVEIKHENGVYKVNRVGNCYVTVYVEKKIEDFVSVSNCENF